ncbi:type II/IV secretion system protein [Candidatus Daviesbacteria bacterium]|nr:type II/IV secretion system protein [Candidatus Daviesbacteria bacterium]
MVISDKDLYNLLLENQLLTEAELKKVQDLAAKDKNSFYDALLKSDLISDENLGKLIADRLKMPFISLNKVSIPQNLLRIIPETVARTQQTIVVSKTDNQLKIATSRPQNKEFESMLSQKTGQKIEVYFATPRDVKEALNLYKQEIQKTFDDLLKQQVDAAGKSDSEAPVSQIVDTMIEYAYENKASDIHIEPEDKRSLIRFRIDGILHDVLALPRNLHDQVITKIKVLSKLRTDEHLSAQDGKLQIKLKDEDLDVRVSIVPIVDGEKVVLRLLTSRHRQFGLSDLGMSEQEMKRVEEGFTKPFGMILSTGPTGSGKSTSIYAILKILNSREKNIATIEDPVEYDVEGINQIQVNPKTNLTFAEGLRSILRQDPDIIYVGEIRDDETADIAINSAMTGHLVLSTLHTNDAATALPRLIDMGIEPFLVASTVNIIIAQRLIRKICEKCKASYTQTFEEVTKVFPPDLIKKHFGDVQTLRVYHGTGCAVCHSTGYSGRIGIFEVLKISEEIKKLITQKADSDTIAKKAILEGMTTMMEDGLDKIQLGVTTLEEVIRVTKET